MSKTARGLRGGVVVVVGVGVLATSELAPASLAVRAASPRIASAHTSGTVASPEVTVTGSGFGARPATRPRYSPAGKFGCPKVPVATAGHLYGDELYFTDLRAKKGTYKNWTAGQFDTMFQDCIGIVIDHWSNTEVRFHFGSLYGKVFPGNTYFLSNGDRFEVFVRRAKLAGTATLTG